MARQRLCGLSNVTLYRKGTAIVFVDPTSRCSWFWIVSFHSLTKTSTSLRMTRWNEALVQIPPTSVGVGAYDDPHRNGRIWNAPLRVCEKIFRVCVEGTQKRIFSKARPAVSS